LRERTLRSGDIYWVNLDPSIGDEIRKKRPVVILNPGHVKHLRLAVVVLVTGWKRQWENHPFFVSLEPTPANGLAKKSAVDCFQLRAISHNRFLGKVGSATEIEMDKMKTAIALILDIDAEHCQ
jgi:mRNA interferase MazF